MAPDTGNVSERFRSSPSALPGVTTGGTAVPGNKSDTACPNCSSERRQMRAAVVALQFIVPPVVVPPGPVEMPVPVLLPVDPAPVEGPPVVAPLGPPVGGSPKLA